MKSRLFFLFAIFLFANIGLFAQTCTRCHGKGIIYFQYGTVPTDIIIQKNSVPYATSGFHRESHTPTPVPHAMVAVVFVAPIQIILPETTTHPKRRNIRSDTEFHP